MSRQLLILLATALIVVPVASFAELQELFIPVTGSEAATVEAENEYFLKQYLYFADRHQIVRVSGSVLKSGENFTISLFDGLSLTVVATQLDERKTQSVFNWRGTIIEPSLAVDAIAVDGITREQAEFMHSSMFDISIAFAEYVDDVRTNTSQLAKDGGSQSTGAESSSFYEATADIIAPTLPTEYSLRALGMSPGYHVLVEIDRAKKIPLGPLEEIVDPEQAIKRRQYDDFMESLGEDPRRAKRRLTESSK